VNAARLGTYYRPRTQDRETHHTPLQETVIETLQSSTVQGSVGVALRWWHLRGSGVFTTPDSDLYARLPHSPTLCPERQKRRVETAGTHPRRSSMY
jgi:hypothetical protein